MKFSDELNNYIKILDCTPKELSEATGLSATIISRYINDKRTPRVDSEYFTKMVEGLNKIAKNKNIKLKSDVFETLSKSITYTDINFDDFVVNFNRLLTELKISTSEIAKAIGYDSSFISKIKNKTRKPSDINKFIDEVGNYIVENYHTDDEKKNVASLIGCQFSKLNDNEIYKNTFIRWITSTQVNHNEVINRFLKTIDNFNLNEYVGTDFNKIKVPSSPIILKTTKIYYGKEGRKEAEAEFLKNTLMSKSQAPIYFYSDLPMEEASNDENFKQTWVRTITMILKKGLHLNIIHNVDRSLNEMLIGIENWIPIYIIGSISPYYFKTPPANIFTGSYMSSGSCALSGECMQDNLDKSRFYFTNKKEEVEYYNEKLTYMISKAKPLMDIYKEEDIESYKSFINKDENSNTHNIKNDTFKNIDFTINKGKWVMINKQTTPQMHFVIYNDKLRNAIETFLTE